MMTHIPPLSSHPPLNTQSAAALAALTTLFPTTSPAFLASCVAHHLSQPRSPALTVEEVVGRISEKVLEDREGRGRETEGEEVRGWIVKVWKEGEGEGIAGREEVRRAFGAQKREEKGRVGRTRRTRRVDETLARNLALIRLHALFPLEPTSSLRALVLREKDSWLSRGVEEVLKTSFLRDRRARDRREKEREGRALGMMGWREVWEALFPPAPTWGDPRGKRKSVARDKDDAEAPTLLTPGDLLHSPSYNAALTTHFRSLFPLVAATHPGRIGEVVEREGGSYEGMRGRLEECEMEAGERRARARGWGWWGRLMGLQEVESDEAGAKGKSSKREERGEVHPLLMRDVEEFWRARDGTGGKKPAATGIPTKTKDDPTKWDPPNVEDDCQCCFAPISPDPAHSVCCASSTPSSSDCHSFCHACVAALVRTYTFDGAPLPSSLLSNGSIPCFAASSSSCTHQILSSSLTHILDPPLRSALDRRIIESTLDRLAASGANLARCPFCPYAVLRDSGDAAGPLECVFVQAWVARFPPSGGEVIRTLVGVVCLLALVVVGSLVVLLFGGSAKLERTYDELYPSTTSSSAPDRDDHRSTPLLSLQTNLVLAPHHTPLLILTHISTLVSRILSLKTGRDTVFACGASGLVGGGREGRKDERWLRRLEGVQELEWEEEEEEEGQEGAVEERRRERLVRYLWPADAEAGAREGEGEVWKPCGRLSCTLCSAQLNPSAPSLHRCCPSSSPSQGSPTAPSEQAQAEESLRLAVEKAMSDAVSWVCEKCGARGRKEVGVGACNKVTCRCGTSYCHLCHLQIPPAVGYQHFCQHPHDPRTGICDRGCGKCGLWTEPDEKKKVEEARWKAQRKWALDHPDWAEKVNLSSSLKRVGPDLDVDSLTEQVWDGYDAVVATVARMLLS